MKKGTLFEGSEIRFKIKIKEEPYKFFDFYKTSNILFE